MMTLVDVPSNWDWIVKTVGPALKGASVEKLRSQLDDGTSVAMKITGDADALIILHTGRLEDNSSGLWVSYLAGTFFGGPKQRAKTMRNIMRVIEETARTHGCKAVIIEGRIRAWTRALTDLRLTTLRGIPVARKAL